MQRLNKITGKGNGKVNQKDPYVDVAAVSYIQTCLKGRAIRLQKKWNSIPIKELLLLNEPCFDNNVTEKVERIPAKEPIPFEERVADKLMLEEAMSDLTPNEAKVIVEVFWNQKKVKQLCQEWCVSKNTVLKTKRNALNKMRKSLKGCV